MRLLPLLLTLCAFVVFAAPASLVRADEAESVKEGFKEIGDCIKKVTKSVGKKAKKDLKAIDKKAKKTFKKADKDVKKAIED
jgi:ElaB/YqjD/DUF883 family membrane-anchored ribosome-binding protein